MKIISRLVFVAALVLGVTTSAFADLQGQLDGVFGQMTNVTQPGVFNTQRRGVISGGSIVSRSRIFDENLIGAQMPSLKAGCGGIDMFGGSFSFVNADQLVELLRAVASNAKGYAFQLALETVCAECSKIMENIQKKIQALNEHLSNSCQLAQGLINSTADLVGWDAKGKTNTTLRSIGEGIGSDFSDLALALGGKGPEEQQKTADPAGYKDSRGNITWQALKKANVDSWFHTVGDDDLNAAILSLSGSIIVGDISGSGADSASKTITILPGNKLSLEQLVTGGEHVPVYSCASDLDRCMNAGEKASGTKEINLKGMQQKVLDMFLGDGTHNGLVYKFANNTGALSAAEEAFMVNLPQGVGGVFRNLAVLSPASATAFANDASGPIAVSMSYDFASELIRSAEAALAKSNSDFAPKAIEQLKESRRKLVTERDVLVTKYGNLSSILDDALKYIAATRKTNYSIKTLTHPQK